jgi:hypothetical protein
MKLTRDMGGEGVAKKDQIEETFSNFYFWSFFFIVIMIRDRCYKAFLHPYFTNVRKASVIIIASPINLV